MCFEAGNLEVNPQESRKCLGCPFGVDSCERRGGETRSYFSVVNRCNKKLAGE